MGSNFPASIKFSACAVSEIILGSFKDQAMSQQAQTLLDFVINTRREYITQHSLLSLYDNSTEAETMREVRSHILKHIQVCGFRDGSTTIDWLHALSHPRSSYFFDIPSANSQYLEECGLSN